MVPVAQLCAHYCRGVQARPTAFPAAAAAGGSAAVEPLSGEEVEEAKVRGSKRAETCLQVPVAAGPR